MQSPDAAAEACWHGALPAVFTLAPDEITTLQPPRAFRACLPRQTFLPFGIYDSVRSHFEPFGPPMGGKMWLEHAGTPLRWHLPVGVLFDLLAGEEATASLPWAITVHFQSFPEEQLMQASAQEAEAILLHALKESCFLRCGSAMPAMSLSPASQQALVDALATDDLAAAHAGYVPIMQHIASAVQMQLGGRTAPRAVPIRLFTSVAKWRQQPLSPVAPSGAPATLRDALQQLLPATTLAAPVDATAAAEGGNPKAGADSVDASWDAVVQGVRMPVDTPLQWLWSACAHPDGWLYVSVRLLS